MRTPTSTLRSALVIVLAVAALASSASAQDGASALAPAVAPQVAAAQATPRTPFVTFELAARFGMGHAWASSSEMGGLPAIGGGDATTGALGASASIRHYGTGLGVTGGFTSAFTGLDTHYGTQAFDVRLSERFTFFRRPRVALSVLGEVGYTWMNGGAHDACPWNWFSDSPSTCVDRDVAVSGEGVIGALGFMVQSSVFLGGVEVDYRHLVGGGALVAQDDVIVLLRVGVGFDL